MSKADGVRPNPMRVNHDTPGVPRYANRKPSAKGINIGFRL